MTYTVQIQGRKLVNFIYSCCVYLGKAVNTTDGFTGRHRCVLLNNCSAKLFGCELKHDDFNEIFFKNYLQNICMHHYQKSHNKVEKILDRWSEHVGSSPGHAPQNGNFLFVKLPGLDFFLANKCMGFKIYVKIVWIFVKTNLRK